MPELVTAKSTASSIEDIITKTESVIFIVSAYFNLGDNVKKRLKVATEDGKYLIVCYRKLDNSDLQFFNSLDNTYIKHIPNLHAKYFFNESGMMVIGSMNLSEHSEINNWEIGFSIDAKYEEDADLFYGVIEEYLHNA